ncbi:MAG TPA: dihydrofolate reductase family protein [Nitrososphaerales archaeon]|nr:dihydrofolate reductase family protein [Nitrososphaerales archaeon]
MRKIIASEFVSADGYMSGPKEDMGWVMNNFNEEMGKYAGDLMESMDTVLLGRVTYGIMAGAWPNMTEESSPGATKMNSVRKVVVSSTRSTQRLGASTKPRGSSRTTLRRKSGN